MSKKIKKFKVDQWALYCTFPDSEFDTLRNERKRALILYVLPDGEIYDYEIFIDDGSSRIKKVKQENLFELNK